MKPGKRFKVAVVTSHPTQWEGPMFAVLQRDSDIDLRVYYGSRLGLGAEAEHGTGMKIRFDVPGIVDGYSFSTVPVGLPGAVLSLRKEFVENRFDAVILEGYAGHPQRAGLLVAASTRTPMIMRLDSTHLYGEPALKRAARGVLVPIGTNIFSSFLALSTPTVEYLTRYGVDPERIVLSTYRVHNDWYRTEAEKWRSTPDISADLGLSRFDSIVLAVLRFEERESPLDFVEAAIALRHSHPRTGFVLIGDGSLMQDVRRTAETHGLDNLVLPGYLPLSALPKYYALANVFVHPAREECWGLSVNEAMACGVPVVVADSVGCRYDLIPDGRYGRTYPSGNVAHLAEAVSELLAHPDRASEVARAAARRIGEYSYAAAVPEFERAVAAVGHVGPSLV